jgi:phosphonate transport system ATP-binding protein
LISSIYGLNGVGKKFGERRHTSVALRNLTLNIAQGEQVALLGPSGSGKTTLFRLLNGSIFPSSGQLLYRDRDFAAMSNAQLREMRRKIGSVYQQHYLVSGMSVLRNTLSGALGRWNTASTLVNLVSPRTVEVERAEHCLETVGLKEKRRFHCDQLSGGQQQRLAIARTLMQEPEVILADEPVASLDRVLSEEILDLLVRLADDGRLTLLISLHQVDLARRYSKRIVALRNGEIAFDVPTHELDEQSLEQLYRSSREPSGQPRPGALHDSAGGINGADSSQKRPCIR